MSKLTKEQIESLQKDYIAKLPIKEICEKYNISKVTVQYHCKKLKSERNDKKSSFKLSKEDFENIREAYAENIIPVKDILINYGISYSTLYQCCAGLPRRMKNTRKIFSQEVIDKIKEDYYINQLPISEIQSKFNIFSSTIYYYCPMNRMRKLSTKEISDIIRDFQDGNSIKTVALKYNISPSMITTYNKTIEKGRGRRLSQLIIDSMRDDAKRGICCKELAIKYHIGMTTVYRYCGDILKEHKNCSNSDQQ